MGRSVPCKRKRGRDREMAAGFRGFSSCKYHVHSRFARMYFPYYRVQQSGGQNFGRTIGTTRYADWTSVRVFRLLERHDDQRYMGIEFTSPIDAKQFRECCSPSFKISRKASSSYSLKLEPPNKQKIKTRRKPLSTPASPSRSREPQCTCMTPEQLARFRSQEARYRGFCTTSTLPRTMARSTEVEMTPGRDKITAATSSASLYDNVNNANVTPGKTAKAGESKQKEKQNETCQTTPKTAT